MYKQINKYIINTELLKTQTWQVNRSFQHLGRSSDEVPCRSEYNLWSGFDHSRRREIPFFSICCPDPLLTLTNQEAQKQSHLGAKQRSQNPNSKPGCFPKMWIFSKFHFSLIGVGEQSLPECSGTGEGTPGSFHRFSCPFFSSHVSTRSSPPRA